MSRHRDSACQKHELPKSLQGTEDAEFIWSMILERFPNAAPLLCDMEALVDRAENLLQQLRAPCQQEAGAETSASFYTLDSEDSSELLSARGSLSIDNDNAEIGKKRVACVQYTEDSNTYDADIDSSDKNGKSIAKSREVEIQSNNSFTVQLPSEGKRLPAENSATSKCYPHAEQRAKEARSLEEWERVVDNAMKKSIGGNDNAFTEDVVCNDGVRSDGVGESAKCSKSKQHGANKVDSNEHEKACVILHRQAKRVHVDDSTTHVRSDQIIQVQEQIEINNDNAVNPFNGSGDESLPKKASKRTPLRILEDYAKCCNATVVYDDDEPNRRKSKVFVIRGSLCGFTASAQGDTEESAKNNLAVKMLQLIANWQMDDDKPSMPALFSKDEMLEIIDLGTENPRIPGHRRLYRLCLEQGQQTPTYSVEKVENSFEGLAYVATCSALGYTGEGRGVRDSVAKKEAANDLYRRYCQDQRSTLKVTVSRGSLNTLSAVPILLDFPLSRQRSAR